jgi:hypothetical protein
MPSDRDPCYDQSDSKTSPSPGPLEPDCSTYDVTAVGTDSQCCLTQLGLLQVSLCTNAALSLFTNTIHQHDHQKAALI